MSEDYKINLIQRINISNYDKYFIVDFQEEFNIDRRVIYMVLDYLIKNNFMIAGDISDTRLNLNKNEIKKFLRKHKIENLTK